MDMFDQLHRRFFAQLFGVSEDHRKAVAKLLADKGHTQAEIEQALANLDRITPGKVFGHAHAIDATSIIEQAFYREGVRRLVLEVAADGDEETYDGHLNITVQDVERW